MTSIPQPLTTAGLRAVPQGAPATLMQQPPVFAVVVHYRNTAATVACLEAVARQVGVRCELVVVEQSLGNQDAQAIGRVIGGERGGRVMSSTENLGFAGGCNLALGEILRDAPEDAWVWLINPDAVPAEDALAELLEVAGSAERLGAVASTLSNEAASGRTCLWLGSAAPGVVATPDFVSGASVLLRGKALREVGGFDERLFLYWEDVDLCLRLRRAGWSMAVAEGSRVAHVGGGSIGNKSAVQDYYSARNALLVVRKHAWWALPVAMWAVLGRVTVGKVWRREWGRVGPAVTGWSHGMMGRGGRAPGRFLPGERE